MTAAALPMAIPAHDVSTMPGLTVASKKAAGAGSLSSLKARASEPALAGTQAGGASATESLQAQQRAVWKEILAAQNDLVVSTQAKADEAGDEDAATALEGKQKSVGAPGSKAGAAGIGMRSRSNAAALDAPSSLDLSGLAVSDSMVIQKLMRIGLGAGKMELNSASPADATEKKAAAASTEKATSAAKTKGHEAATHSTAASVSLLSAVGIDMPVRSQALSSSEAAHGAGRAAGDHPPARQASGLSTGSALQPGISLQSEAAVLMRSQRALTAVLAGSSQSVSLKEFGLPGPVSTPQNASAGGEAVQASLSAGGASGQGDWTNSLRTYGVIQDPHGAPAAGKAEAGKSVSGVGAIAANHSSRPLHNSVSAAGDSNPSSAEQDAKPAGQPAASPARSPKAVAQKGDTGGTSALAHPGGQPERQPFLLKGSEITHGKVTGGEDSGLAIHAGSDLTVSQPPAFAKSNAEASKGQVSPFLAMDASPSAGAASSASQLHAGSSSSGLVAGYHDPQLGYVELKAHLGSDGVHASIAAATPEVSSILAGHMPALHQWLHERQTPVETLSIGLRESGTDRGGTGNMTGQGGSPGGAFAGGHSSADQDQSQGGWSRGQESNTGVNRIGNYMTAAARRVMESSIDAAPAASAVGLHGSAAYISVLA